MASTVASCDAVNGRRVAMARIERHLNAEELATGPEPPAAVDEFGSILFGSVDADVGDAEQPPFFADLNLDLVEAIVARRDEYELKPFFHTPLRDVELIGYRHEVFGDLEVDDVRAAVSAFGDEMRKVRQYLTLAQKQQYKYEKERWFLDAAAVYCAAVSALRDALVDSDLSSRGLQALRIYLSTYATFEGFSSLASDVRSVLDGLRHVRYTLRIKGARVTVSAYEDEPDYSVEVEETFARFRQGAVEDHLVKVPDSGSMDHVEAWIAQRVARLYPKEFRALDEFCARHRGFLDRRLATFDREVQFYLSYLEYTERLAATQLAFCYPTLSELSKQTSVEDAFDIALAAKLASERGTVVCNDFSLPPPERILVVTGPNQGGKTTFARVFGQLHYLAGLGVPVPARSARLFLPDRLFTHFEKEEDIRTLRGKLDDELVRIRDILQEATGDSIVILNEIASLSEATVSMVATVAPDDPSTRTFKIVRRPADGRAYAWALADKYGLSYDRLKGRIR